MNQSTETLSEAPETIKSQVLNKTKTYASFAGGLVEATIGLGLIVFTGVVALRVGGSLGDKAADRLVGPMQNVSAE